MKRIEHNVEHHIGLKGAKVLADVAGFKVEIVAFTFGEFGDCVEANFIGLLLPNKLEKIKEELRDYSPIADAVIHDWDLHG